MKKTVFSFLFFLLVIALPFTIVSKDVSKSGAKKAIVIGATSGMGREVAKLLSKEGYVLGLVGRRVMLLESLQESLEEDSYIKRIDVSDHENAAVLLNELIEELGGLDLIMISISSFIDTGFADTWEANKKIIDVDIAGFWVMAHTALQYFEQQKSGHLVGISSIDGLRGSASCPIFSGAKAFVSRYLEGVRNRMIRKKIPICVTDIVPGWVNVEHTAFSALPGTFWVSTKEEAAKQIVVAIKSKKKLAYITKRWGIVALLLSFLPDVIYNNIDKLRVGVSRVLESAGLA